LKINPDDLSSNLPNIFAGGDFVTGPGMVIHAIAGGMRGAIAIDKYLRGDTSRVLLRDSKAASSVETGVSEEEVWKTRQRMEMSKLPPEERKNNFNAIDIGFSEDEAREEARRCLRCDQENK
jgi:NADH-quinone oxidoreductase subunit F